MNWFLKGFKPIWVLTYFFNCTTGLLIKNKFRKKFEFVIKLTLKQPSNFYEIDHLI